VYLEYNTASENFEARIMKYIVTRPLQLTHHTKIRILWHYHWKWTLLLLWVIQFCVIHFKTLLYTKSYITFSAVYLSAFLHRFLSLAFASLCTYTTLVLRFSLQHSLSLESYIKHNLSLCVCQLPASLTLHYFSTSTSEQSFSKIS
jgi:hypothetical protein